MPRNRLTRRRAISCLLAGFLLSAGCIAPSGGGVSDAQSVGEAVHQRYDSIDSYSATVTRTVATSTGTHSVRADVAVDIGDEMRIAYRTGPRSGTVQRIDLSSGAATRPLLSSGIRQATEGQATSYGALASELVRTNNVSLERTTTLDDRRTVVVSLVPHSTENRTTSVERRLWIDTERMIPLRIQTTVTTADGRAFTETVRYSNVTVDESVERSRPVGYSQRAVTAGGSIT